MAKHVLSITYREKENGVRCGTVCQTIRKGNKVMNGDTILFHGWDGVPYRSKWSWRKDVEVTQAHDVVISQAGIQPQIGPMIEWGDPDADVLAGYDGIDPPTGSQLYDVLRSMHRITKEGEPYQVIRWAPVFKPKLIEDQNGDTVQ